MSKKKKRYSLSLRFQPYEGDLMAEIVQYLQELPKDEVMHKVADALITTLLPYARYCSMNFTPEQIRLACFEAQNSLDKHGRNMRLALGVEQPQEYKPQQTVPQAATPVAASDIKMPATHSPELQEPNESDITEAEIDRLFD